jgi:uncharacterized protein YaiL (DUF2058 family)
MQSLRDKLLQAGLVTQEQAERSKQPVRPPKPAPRPAAPSKPVRFEPPPESDKDRERRLNRELAAKQQQVRVICDAGEVEERGEQTFFFRTRKRELRRLYLTPEQVKGLETGDLAIVDRPNGQDRPHALVPRAYAESILTLEPKAIRFWARSPTESYGFEEEPPEAAVDSTEATTAEATTAEAETKPSESEPKT